MVVSSETERRAKSCLIQYKVGALPVLNMAINTSINPISGLITGQLGLESYKVITLTYKWITIVKGPPGR